MIRIIDGLGLSQSEIAVTIPLNDEVDAYMDRIEMRIYGGRAAVLSLGVNQNSTL